MGNVSGVTSLLLVGRVGRLEEWCLRRQRWKKIRTLGFGRGEMACLGVREGVAGMGCGRVGWDVMGCTGTDFYLEFWM